MIVEALVTVLGGVTVFFLDLIPDFPVPDWVSSGSSGVSTVFGYAASLSAWVPLGLVVPVLGTVTAALLVGLGIKLVRMILSVVSGGGGSAG